MNISEVILLFSWPVFIFVTYMGVSIAVSQYEKKHVSDKEL